MPSHDPHTQPIADALIHVQCAYTSLARWEHFGLLDRERPWFARIAPLFKRIVLVTYGGSDDHAVAASLIPADYADRVTCIANDHDEEPARFQAGVPDRILRTIGLPPDVHPSAIVFTDQHYGGEVAIAITNALRDRSIRTGLVARGGYHWSWFTARDHGPDSPQAALAAAREGELCRAADIVVGSTRRMTDDLAWRHALPPDKLRLIPNFVSMAEPPPVHAPARDHGLMLAAGRLEPQKRFDVLIRAVALLVRTHPRVLLRIRGEGSLHSELEALIRTLNAPAEILPRIPQSELADEMARCSVFAQVSAFEGHPKTIIEALASGAPVVVTRGPGVDDEITPGLTGLVTRDDPAAIAAAIASLLDDPEHAARMGRAAAADIRARLGLDAVFPLVKQACREALALNGTLATMPTGTVRWDQTLLNADPAAAAAAFAGAVNAYTKRLEPQAREAFHDALDGALTPHQVRTPASSTT